MTTSPPVVPDSEPTCATCNQVWGHWRHATHPFIAKEASASGVVPDKPALAPDDWPSNRLCDLDCTDFRHTFGRGRCAWASPGTPASEMPEAWPVVPAVTDDEAATEVIAEALCESINPGSDVQEWQRRAANDMLSGLRAAGYSLVRSTREDT